MQWTLTESWLNHEFLRFRFFSPRQFQRKRGEGREETGNGTIPQKKRQFTRTSLWHMLLSVLHNIPPHYCLLLPHSALAAAELTLTVTTGTRSAASTCTTHNILWRHQGASFKCTRTCLLELFDHVMIIKCDDFTFPINCDIALHCIGFSNWISLKKGKPTAW